MTSIKQNKLGQIQSLKAQIDEQRMLGNNKVADLLCDDLAGLTREVEA